MSASIMADWLSSGKPACIEAKILRPREHPCLPGAPLEIQRGQAVVYPLVADDGSEWMLKKFHQGRTPDIHYMQLVASSLPSADGFRAGTARLCLTARSMQHQPGSYRSSDLAAFLSDALLMPRIPGYDWATLADDIRSGQLKMDPSHRIALCRSLSDLFCMLEARGMAHRDISSGNVFIDPAAWVIYLIDFDSLYMPNLPMPAATTCGTAGYTAPFTWTAYGYEPTISWCALADRYSLAILCAEILTIDVSSPATNEGGLFAQEELRVGNGPGIQRIRAVLRNRFPAADILLDRTLRSRRFADCPSPGDWLAFCNANGAFGKPPALDEIERVLPDYFAKILQNRRRPAPLWPAPKLPDLPNEKPVVRQRKCPVVPLPPDPWANVA